ncbi:hypothetical protein LCGC14_1042370 [marine sediment metagenome]|uniref:Uncharacterized protein n=1 Tax=marine sediment metagenome TaxID=412755 RepID=A0A0F9Q9N4_9ZZZZ
MTLSTALETLETACKEKKAQINRWDIYRIVTACRADSVDLEENIRPILDKHLGAKDRDKIISDLGSY